ncbi:MAG TPA: RNA polymerase sigma factor [Candidatus Kapabacteria bacterium]|nr:RNA polymerase sigma factor [Candidatus Kapabacteria bacterium]
MSFLETENHERFLGMLEPIRSGFARFCRAISNDRELGRDLASESILIVYEHFDSLRDQAKFKSYLFTTAARLAKRQRHRERNKAPYDAQTAEQISGGMSPDATADIELLYATLEKLPTDQREAVVMFEIAGLSLEEIRQIQGGSLSGVKSRIARGREKLAKLLGVRNELPTHNFSSETSAPRTLIYARTSAPVIAHQFNSEKL